MSVTDTRLLIFVTISAMSSKSFLQEEKPDARLSSAIPFVRVHDRIADIGTDHAKLPIYLVREGICPEALATDINKGPLKRAEDDINRAGLSSHIKLLLTDGLEGVEPFHPDTILIFGMGGELIARILGDAPWIKDPSLRLILQPMTHDEDLRSFLYTRGFEIMDELISYASGKYYVTICASFSGKNAVYGPEDVLLGALKGKTADASVRSWIEQKLKRTAKIIQELDAHGIQPEQDLLDKMQIYSKKLREDTI